MKVLPERLPTQNTRPVEMPVDVTIELNWIAIPLYQPDVLATVMMSVVALQVNASAETVGGLLSAAVLKATLTSPGTLVTSTFTRFAIPAYGEGAMPF